MGNTCAPEEIVNNIKSNANPCAPSESVGALIEEDEVQVERLTVLPSDAKVFTKDLRPDNLEVLLSPKTKHTSVITYHHKMQSYERVAQRPNLHAVAMGRARFAEGRYSRRFGSKEKVSKSISREAIRSSSRQKGTKVHTLRGVWDSDGKRYVPRSGSKDMRPLSQDRSVQCSDEADVDLMDVEISIGKIKPKESEAKFKKPVGQIYWWNPQPSPFIKLSNGMRQSTTCTWHLQDIKQFQLQTRSRDPIHWWNIQPFDRKRRQIPIICHYLYTEMEGEEEEYELKPEFWTDDSEYDSEIHESARVTFKEQHDNRSPSQKSKGSLGRKSLLSGNDSVLSIDLFKSGKDDIVLEGELMKFKPGISQNFIPRYVQWGDSIKKYNQFYSNHPFSKIEFHAYLFDNLSLIPKIPRQISQRAFRYFKNKYEAKAGKPIVAFRKKIIKSATGINVNKHSYLKPGSKIAQSKKEDHLFDNMFEILLNEDYEDNYNYRDLERAKKELIDRKEFEDQMGVKKVKKRNGKTVYKNVRSSASRSQTKSKSAAIRTEKEAVDVRPFNLRKLSDNDGVMRNQSFITKSKTPKILSPELKLNLKSSFGGTVREPSYHSFGSNGSAENEYQFNQNTSPRRKAMPQIEQVQDVEDQQIAVFPFQNPFTQRHSFGGAIDPMDSSRHMLKVNPSSPALMRVPQTQRNFWAQGAEASSQASGRQSYLIDGRTSRAKSKKHDKSIPKPKKETKIIGGHLMAIRDKRRGTTMQHHLHDQKITAKDFGKDDNDGKDAILWKNREKDWYNAERRFVFAAPTPKLHQKWIQMIIMDKVKTGLKEGIARTIMKSRQQRGLESGLGSSKTLPQPSTIEDKQLSTATNLDAAPQKRYVETPQSVRPKKVKKVQKQKQSAAKTADQTPTIFQSSQNSKSQVRERESMPSRQYLSPKGKALTKSVLSISNQTDNPLRVGVLQKKRDNYESFTGLASTREKKGAKLKRKADKVKSPIGSSRNQRDINSMQINITSRRQMNHY